MENKILTVAIIGVGGRVGDIYGTIISKNKNFKITSLCDLRVQRLERYGKQFGVNEENLFTDENEFFKEKRADILIVATQDADHVRHMLIGLKKGYDILVEKPLTDKEDECAELINAQKKYGGKVLVCHVLRYAPVYLKIDEILKSGVIGKLICIDATERVHYWHQAHSYVRGNWRKREECTPMILAKCCHDLDLLQYYANSKCKSISSVGDLTFFKRENQPEGASDRCVTCKYIDTCPYSAKDIYINKWKQEGCPEDVSPYNIIAPAPMTEEKLLKAIQEGPYGRCVFACDNNVVDHQIVMMSFYNGIKASLTMTGFTGNFSRRMVLHGTLGEIIYEGADSMIKLFIYGEDRSKPIIYNTKDLPSRGYSHGGGDDGLINDLYDIMSGKEQGSTTLEKSIESHLMGIYAEKSRLENGKLFYVHEIEKNK